MHKGMSGRGLLEGEGKGGGMGGKWGGHGEVAGIAHGMWIVEGCGGMRWRKLGPKWEKNGTEYSFFTVPCLPFFQRPKIFPRVPFVKIS